MRRYRVAHSVIIDARKKVFITEVTKMGEALEQAQGGMEVNKVNIGAIGFENSLS
jgi:hypothetical protein